MAGLGFLLLIHSSGGSRPIPLLDVERGYCQNAIWTETPVYPPCRPGII